MPLLKHICLALFLAVVFGCSSIAVAKEGFRQYKELSLTQKPRDLQPGPFGKLTQLLTATLRDFRDQHHIQNAYMLEMMRVKKENETRKRIQLVHGLNSFDPYNLSRVEHYDPQYFKNGVGQALSRQILAQNPNLARVNQGIRWQVSFSKPEEELIYVYTLVPKAEFAASVEESKIKARELSKKISTQEQEGIFGPGKAYLELHRLTNKLNAFNPKEWTIGKRRVDATQAKAPKKSHADQEIRTPPQSQKLSDPIIAPPKPEMAFQVAPQGSITNLIVNPKFLLTAQTLDGWYKLDYILEETITQTVTVPVRSLFNFQTVWNEKSQRTRSSITGVKLGSSPSSAKFHFHLYDQEKKGVFLVDRHLAGLQWSLSATKYDFQFSSSRLEAEEFGLHFNWVL